MKILLTALITFNSIFAFSQSSHSAFSQLLEKHVDKTGRVNYETFLSNAEDLDSYIFSLSLIPPEENWTKNEKLAYWINAYNALTIQIILKHYPIQSMHDIRVDIDKKNDALGMLWDIKCFDLGEKKLSLNEIEHSIMRKKFTDPRIHFAMVSGAVSSPKLRKEAYEGLTLNNQLKEQTTRFINNNSKNRLAQNKLELSQIFDWYKNDFTADGTIVDFIKKYTSIEINPSVNPTYLNYDWKLNKQ